MMETELTLSNIFEALAEGLASARTRALMGERTEALATLRAAFTEYTRYRKVLEAYPGVLALEHAFESTLAALTREECDSTPGSGTRGCSAA